jgi:hypothetical protein
MSSLYRQRLMKGCEYQRGTIKMGTVEGMPVFVDAKLVNRIANLPQPRCDHPCKANHVCSSDCPEIAIGVGK